MDRGCPGGGSLGLGQLIDDHGAELAFDLQRYLSISLADVVADLCSDTPQSSPRWWIALIGQLPMDGAFAAANLGSREHRDWGVVAYLLAALLDAVQVNTTVTARAAGAKKFPAPTPAWRPGASQPKRRGTSLSALLPSRRRQR